MSIIKTRQEADRSRRQPKGSFSTASTVTYGIDRNSRQGWAPLLSRCMHNLSPVILVPILPTDGKLSELWSIRQWLSLDDHPSRNWPSSMGLHIDHHMIKARPVSQPYERAVNTLWKNWKNWTLSWTLKELGLQTLSFRKYFGSEHF